MFFLSIDCPFCCKVQIILCFESRLHIHYIVHGFCSIIHWLLFTLFSHISFHRKKFNYSLYQLWWIFSGLYDTGRMGVNNCTYCFSGCHTIRLWGQMKRRKKKPQTHTCIQIAYWSSCFPYVWVFYRSLLTKSWHRSSNKPKAQKADIHIQLMCECLTYSSRILPSVSLLLEGSFKTLCQLNASTWNWCPIKHKESVLRPSSPPKTTS